MRKNGVKQQSVNEYANLAAFPTIGEASTIYIAADTGAAYRWSGSIYDVLNKSIFQPKNEGWKSWTPVFTNFTLGNGLYNASYTIDPINKLVHCKITITLGTTSVMGTRPRFTLPLQPHAQHTSFENLGHGTIYTPSTAFAYRVAGLLNTNVGSTVIEFYFADTGYTAISPTIPTTWVSGDIISINLVYRAA
jgi:hypothetical protein